MLYKLNKASDKLRFQKYRSTPTKPKKEKKNKGVTPEKQMGIENCNLFPAGNFKSVIKK